MLFKGGEFLIIKQSHALKMFKKEVGQANHMLITIIVGLDGIITHNVEPNNEFRVSWNPRDKNSSVQRSKLYAKKSVLAWITDCIDMYLRLINQSPTIIQDSELKNQIDSESNSRSVYKRIHIICYHCKITSVNYALADLLICWRNRLTHYQAENDISSDSRNVLESMFDEIKNKYGGLDIHRTLESFSSTSFPTFKEVTAFVKSSINLIHEIDVQLIQKAKLEKYADQIFIKYFQQNQKDRLSNIFSKDQETKAKSLKQLLLQYGFCNQECNNEVDKLCNNIAQLSFGEAKGKCKLGTFIE